MADRMYDTLLPGWKSDQQECMFEDIFVIFAMDEKVADTIKSHHHEPAQNRQNVRLKIAANRQQDKPR